MANGLTALTVACVDQTLRSLPDEAGTVVVLQLQVGVRILARFDGEAAERDLTEWAAQLCRVGLEALAGTTAGTEAIAEEVSIGEVHLAWALRSPAPCPCPSVEVRALDGRSLALDWMSAARAIATGVAQEVTTGIAAEVAAAALSRLERPSDWLLPPGA